MRTTLAAAFALLLFAQGVFAQPKPGVPETDRVRLAEAFRIGETLGHRVWEDWDEAPFAVLLVTPENEFLIRHPKPPQGFTPAGHDPLLKSDVYYRKTTQNPGFLATFPFNGVATIVIGQAENTSKKSSTPWVVTVLHEHFHQLQYSRPKYFDDVNALDLSRGDQTGMWMLNYAFPYADAKVKEQFAVMCRLLAAALRADNKREFSAASAAYLEARRKFGAMLSPEDYRYFSFQVWQEGMARYTEYRVAEMAARRHKPSKAFRSLKDFRPFKEVAAEIKSGIVKELTSLQLDSYKRVAFYPLGAGEGLLLDRMNPRWQRRYFKDRFYVEKYFEALKSGGVRQS